MGLSLSAFPTSCLSSSCLSTSCLVSGKSFFDKLKELSEPLVVAYEGNNPLETGRYPQPTTVLGLSGVDQKVQVDHTDDFNLQSFTFTTWVKASTWDNGGQTVLFVKPFSSHLSPFYEYGLFVSPTAISFWRQGANFSLPVTLPLGTWVHVALVYGNSSIALYINGVIEHSQSISTFNVTHWGEDIYLFGQGNLSVNSLIGNSSDTCLYSETLTADEVAMEMAGDNPHNPLFCLPLNQTSGTTALDRAGDNHGTLMNGASWVEDNTLPWQADVTNEEGYTLGTGSNGAAVGVIIPPSTIDPTKDCLGNDLQFSGSVYPVIPVPEGSSALSFDGVNQYCVIKQSGFSYDLPFSLCIYFNSSNTSNVGYLFYKGYTSGDVSQRSLVALFNGGTLRVSVGAGAEYVIGTTNQFRDGNWHKLNIVSNGSTFETFIDDVSYGVYNVGVNPSGGDLDDIFIGCRRSALPVTSVATFLDGTVSGFSIKQDGGDLNLPLTETSGTSVIDTSGNGNHGTLVNGPTWVNTRDGYGTNLNQLRGFTLDDSVRIPPLASNPTVDARDGLPLTNPPILPYGHNNSENTENGYNLCEDGSVPSAAVNLGNFNLINFSDTRLDLIGTIPTYTAFRRHVSSVAKDRLIIFHDTLPAGSERNKAITYTNPLEDGTEDPWFDESGVVWEDQAGSLWYNP